MFKQQLLWLKTIIKGSEYLPELHHCAQRIAKNDFSGYQFSINFEMTRRK